VTFQPQRRNAELASARFDEWAREGGGFRARGRDEVDHVEMPRQRGEQVRLLPGDVVDAVDAEARRAERIARAGRVGNRLPETVIDVVKRAQVRPEAPVQVGEGAPVTVSLWIRCRELAQAGAELSRADARVPQIAKRVEHRFAKAAEVRNLGEDGMGLIF